jgi:hypothetical protein
MNVINEVEAEQQFLAACPSFGRHLNNFREEWEVGTPTIFHVLDELGRHLAHLVQAGRTPEVVAALGVVERIIDTGSEVVVHATTHGLLTSLQSEARRCGLDPEVFVGDLGPNTWKWWNDLTKNWAAGREW